MRNESERCIAVQGTGVIAEAAQLDFHVPKWNIEQSQLRDAALRIQLIAAGSACMQIRVSGTGCTFSEGHVMQDQFHPLRRTRFKAIQAGYVLGSASSVQKHIPGNLNVALTLLENS